MNKRVVQVARDSGFVDMGAVLEDALDRLVIERAVPGAVLIK
jgi:hypothetical protein